MMDTDENDQGGKPMIEETEKNHTGDNEHGQHQDHQMIGVDAAESLQLPIQQPHKQQQDDDDDDDDARNVIHIPNLLVSEFLDLWSNPTIRAMDNSTNNKNHPISEPTIRNVGTVTTSSNEALALLGLVLIHGSWTQSIQTTCIPQQEQQQKQEEQRQQEQQPSTPTDSATMSMSSSQLSNWLCQATKGIQCHLITARLMICEQTDPEAYHLFMEQPLQNRTTVLPSELPALAVVSQWNTHVGATADNDDDHDHHGGGVGSTSKSRTRTSIRYLNDLASSKLLWQLLVFQQEPKLPELIPGVDSLARQQVRRRWTETEDAITKLVRWAVYELEDELELPTTMITQKHDEDGDDDDPCIRIFVAGDRSSVGKSSTCLGLLGTLMYQLGFEPHQLAYIKPATQSEALHQPIQVFCEHVGIRCVPIGPLVYYRGFTRAFLAGETESTQQLLQHCMDAVDRVARDKRVVIVDGVGFPAVGSICGTDNATMAHVCGYPISINSSSCTSSSSFPQRRPMGALLVGGSGVGAAVDGYNLNAAFFDNAQVPVLGAIFNKLSLTGYYALEHCQKQVSMYFEQRQEQQQLLQQQSDLTPIDRPQPRPFGFVPVFPKLAEQEPDGRTIRIQTVREFIAVFQSHVDVAGILQAAAAYRQPLHASATTTTPGKEPVLAQSLLAKEQQQQQQQASWILKGRTPSTGPPTRTNQQQQQQNRQEIERKAIYAGAAPSA